MLQQNQRRYHTLSCATENLISVYLGHLQLKEYIHNLLETINNQVKFWSKYVKIES